MNDFPYPEIKSFERLQVSDGLMINSERWRLAHEYHQHRQNVQYQSLFLPGIICGLGVAPIAAPADLPAKFRDGRWIQIQPGMAIDLNGNFIVVPQPLDFRIATTAYDQEIETVYLVLSYVDPAKLKRSSSNEVLVETFRVNEKTDPPSDTDIEICRIAIAQELSELKKPADVFAPTQSELDLRHRLQAQIRPQNSIRIATFKDKHPSTIQDSFHFLGKSLPSLAPNLRIIEPIDSLDLNSELTLSHLNPYHLIYLTSDQALALNESTQLALHEYMAIGGVILIEAAIHSTRIKDLLEIQNELQQALNKLRTSKQPQEEQKNLEQDLKAELAALSLEINTSTQDFLNSFRNCIPMETPILTFSDLEHTHPLRSQPFLFQSLLSISEQPTQILTNGAVITILGELSKIWAGQSEMLTRENIRSCQELGINILNYAAQRYAIHQTMLVNPKYQDNTKISTASDQRRITNMVDNPT